MQDTTWRPPRTPPKYLFAIIGAVVLCVVGASIWQGVALSSHGRRIAARQVAVFAHTPTVVAALGLDKTFPWLVSYTAQVALPSEFGVAVRSVSMPLPGGVLAKLEARQTVYVDYLPDRPHVIRFADDDASPWWQLLFPASFFCLQWMVSRRAASKQS